MKGALSCLLICLLGGAPELEAAARRFDGKILGGGTAEIGDFPYQVSVQYFSSHICGGVNITPFFVLTAALCVQSAIQYSISVRVGSSFHASGGIHVGVLEFHMHPQYDREARDYDVAILRLAVGLGSGVGVSAVTLPAPGREFPAGTDAVASGWGITAADIGAQFSPQLRAVGVPIVDREECRAAFADYGSDAITPRMVCAGIPDGSIGPCQGDSGGPLVVDGRILVGVFSWGAGCARPLFPAVYSDIAALRSFIKDVADV